MEKRKELQSSNKVLEIALNGKWSDIIKKPLIGKLDQDQAKAVLFTAVNKTSKLCGANFSIEDCMMYADELLENHKYDHLDTIVLALQKGRNGAYGKTYKFNYPTIKEWIGKALEEVARAREKAHEQNKKRATEHAEIDYKAYIERKEKERQQKKVKEGVWLSPKQRNESYIAGICTHAGISVDEIKSKSRKQHIADARMLCQYWERNTLKWTTTEIADYWGCDHSTVVHNTKKVDDEKNLQKKLADLLDNPPF